MPHGGPDWGEDAPKETVYAYIDMAELAARLGSIVTYDRRGDVITLEDFESGIGRWYKTVLGTASDVTWDGNYYASGGFSMKMATDTAEGDYAMASISFMYTIPGKIGFEFSFMQLVRGEYLMLDIRVYDGSKQRRFAIRWYRETGLVRYLDSGGDWVTLATQPLPAVVTYPFFTMKLVVDTINWEYVRLLLNEESYDIGADCYESVDTTAPHNFMSIAIVNDDGGYATTTRIDNVIVTQNEP
jgi:hypothetical protein